LVTTRSFIQMNIASVQHKTDPRMYVPERMPLHEPLEHEP
jgi:hypothetical protein